MNIPQNVIQGAESHGIPAPILMAIILELSNGTIFWDRKSVELKPEVIETAKLTGFTTEEIALFLALSANYAAAFTFDTKTWATYGQIYGLEPVDRFLLSCKVGLARLPAYKLVLETEIPVVFWEKTIKDFCLDTDKQIDLLAIEIQNYSTPRFEKDKAGILVGISRLFHPEADIAMPIIQDILKHAKFIDQGYQKQLQNERLRIQEKPPRVPNTPPVTEPGAGDKAPRKAQQTVSG